MKIPSASGLARQWRAATPGVIACFVIAAAATFLAEHYHTPVMLFALLIGIAMNFLSEQSACVPGIAVSARTLLPAGAWRCWACASPWATSPRWAGSRRPWSCFRSG
jgi:hypothetical protein